MRPGTGFVTSANPLLASWLYLAPNFILAALMYTHNWALFFAAATEIAQGPIDGRTPSMSDFIADAAGVGLGLLAGGWVAARAQRNRA